MSYKKSNRTEFTLIVLALVLALLIGFASLISLLLKGLTWLVQPTIKTRFVIFERSCGTKCGNGSCKKCQSKSRIQTSCMVNYVPWGTSMIHLAGYKSNLKMN